MSEDTTAAADGQTQSRYGFVFNALGVKPAGPGGEAGLHPSNIHDCEYAIGSINFTGDSPVILTRDGPSLGGFVCPVTIARAELWKVGQVKPGDRIRFVRIDYPQAVALEAAQDRRIAELAPAAPAATEPAPVPATVPMYLRWRCPLASGSNWLTGVLLPISTPISNWRC